MDTTIEAIEAYLAREAYAAVLADYVDGSATEDAVRAAGERVDRAELAVERVGSFARVESHYLSNAGR